jgi:hypothetical protein
LRDERRVGFVGKREAIPFGFCLNVRDCFVASLLAMTFWSELNLLKRIAITNQNSSIERLPFTAARLQTRG